MLEGVKREIFANILTFQNKTVRKRNENGQARIHALGYCSICRWTMIRNYICRYIY